MKNKQFPDKDPVEPATCTVDFTEALRTGESIVSASWTIIGEHQASDASGMLDGPIDISEAPLVRQAIKGGTDGGYYVHRVIALTNTGRPLFWAVRQRVRLGA